MLIKSYKGDTSSSLSNLSQFATAFIPCHHSWLQTSPNFTQWSWRSRSRASLGTPSQDHGEYFPTIWYTFNIFFFLENLPYQLISHSWINHLRDVSVKSYVGNPSFPHLNLSQFTAAFILSYQASRNQAKGPAHGLPGYAQGYTQPGSSWHHLTEFAHFIFSRKFTISIDKSLTRNFNKVICRAHFFPTP